MSAETVVFSQRLTRQRSASKLSWLLAGFHFLGVVGLKASGFGWVEATLSSLPCGPPYSVAPNRAVCSQERKRIVRQTEGFYFDAERVNYTLPGSILSVKHFFDLNGVILGAPAWGSFWSI